MKKLLIAVFAFTAVPVVAQNLLSRDRNLMRDGDIIIKQQVEYKSPGEKGNNVLWNFSDISMVKEKYKLSYKSSNDSCFIGIEHRTRYKFKLIGDSLLSMGFENPLTYLRDSIAKLAMVYPFVFEQKAQKKFYLKGKYSDNNNMVSIGNTSIHADAMGTIILPDADTLNNVLRVHIINDSRIKIFKQNEKTDTINISDIDSLPQHKENIYRWYAKGYRYPIFETVTHTYYKNGEKMSHYNTAFYYPPREHKYITNDEKNDSILKEIRAERDNDKIHKSDTRNNPKNKNNPNSERTDIIEEIVKPSITITPDKIEITYELSSTTEIEIILSDLYGRIFAHIPKQLSQPGSYHQVFDRSRLRPGEYLLCLRRNGENDTSKIDIK